MINLDEHIIEFDGKKYIPYEIAIKAYAEREEYEKNQAKFDAAMKLIETSVQDLSQALNINKIGGEE